MAELTAYESIHQQLGRNRPDKKSPEPDYAYASQGKLFGSSHVMVTDCVEGHGVDNVDSLGFSLPAPKLPLAAAGNGSKAPSRPSGSVPVEDRWDQ